MKFPRSLPHFRSLKFAPFAVIAFFVFSNLTGVLFSHVLAPVSAKEAGFQFPADMPTSGDPELDRIIFQAGEEQGVDPRFLHAVIWQESKYEQHARSHAGAQGLMQLMPATAKRFGCDNPDDPVSNITAGTKYLGWLLKRFSGNVELALAGYNAGEGAVDKYDGVPPYDETRNYVKIISQRYGKIYHPVLPPAEAANVFQLHTTD
jgi:soluble lytic murein transglycosylase-like protein